MRYRKLEYYIMPEDAPMDLNLLYYWLKEHEIDCHRYRHLREMYEGNHPILHVPDKPKWKPDNRIVVNFAKYIVDTLNGYFLGIPVKTNVQDEAQSEVVHEILDANDQDDNNFELSKIMSIYGSGFELVYLVQEADVRITYLTPMETFVIYDDTVERKPLYGVQYYRDREGTLHGMLYSRTSMIPFTDKGGMHILIEEIKSHFFDDVPLIEYIENEERQSAFENAESAIVAYEKALSEKANDVDAFADAYMLIKGLDLDEKEHYTIRNDRVVQVPAQTDADVLNAVDVSFLSRPSGDTTQENLLSRLETQIFTTSMVANISDEDFGGSSGTALVCKLQPMKNLATVKTRKFSSGMNQRWKLICSSISTPLNEDDWKKFRYRFTLNAPQNLLEEAQTAAQMAGITSRKTQLSVLFAVPDVGQEIEQIAEEDGTAELNEYVTER